MKVVRKKGLKRIKIEHNKWLFAVIIILLLLLGYVVYVIIKDRNKIEDVIREDICLSDADCVPAGCCHPDSCVIKEKAPDCSGAICTAVCSGPLDCGAGSCGCINNQCEIIPNKA